MAAAPKQKILDALKRFVPLNMLPEESLTQLLEVARFEKLAQGDVIFEKGDKDDRRVYLLSGKVALIDGRREMDLIDGGSDVARYPLAHQIPRRFTVKARMKSEVVRIDNALLNDLLANAGNISYKVEELEESEAVDDWMSQLLRSRIFQQIPAANIQSVMMRMEEVEVSAGELIIRQGDEGDFFYLIHKGRCAVSLTKKSGEAKELARLGPGESFGEESLLSGKPRGSNVTMLTDGVLLRLGREDFIQFVKQPSAITVSYKKAQQLIEKGACWLDVRTPLDYELMRLPGSLNLPLAELRNRVAELDAEKSYVVYCQDGQQSNVAAYLMTEKGFNALVLENGLDGISPDAMSPGSDVELVAEEAGEAPGGGSGDQAARQEIGLLRAKLTQLHGQLKEEVSRSKVMQQLIEHAKQKLAEAEQEKQAQALQAESQAGAVQASIDKLQEQLAESHRELHLLRKARDNAVRQGEQLTRQLQQADQLRERLAAADEKRKRAEKESAEQQERVDAILAELGEVKAANKLAEAARQGQQAALNGIVQSLESELAGRDGELARLQEEMAQRRARIDALESSLEEERSRAGAARAEQEAEVKRLQEAVEGAQAEREAVNGQLAALRDEHGAGRLEIEQLQGRRAELESALESLGRERGELEGELEQTREGLRDREASLDERDARLAEADSVRERLEAELGQSAEKLQSLEQALAEGAGEAEAASSRWHEEEGRLRALLEEQGAQLARSSESGERLEKALQESKERILILEQSLSEQAGGTESLRLQWQEREQALSSSLVQAREELASLQEALSGSRQQLDEAERLHRQALEEKDEVLARAEAGFHEKESLLQGSLDEATAHRGELEGRLSELEGELQSHQGMLQEKASEAAESDALRARLGGELEQARERIASLESALAERDGASGALQAALDQSVAQLRERDEALEQAREREAGLSAAETGLRGELKAAQERAVALEQTLAERQHEAEREERAWREQETGLQASVKLAEGERELAREQLTRLTAKQKNLHDELVHAREQCALLEASLTEHRQKAQAADAGHAESQDQMQEALDRLRAEYQRNEAELVAAREEAERALAEAGERFDRLSRQHDELIRERDHVREAVSGLQAANDDLETKLGESAAARSELQERFDDFLSRVEAERAAQGEGAAEQAAAMAAAATAREERIAGLEQAIAGLEREREDDAERLRSLGEANDRLETERAQAQQQQQALEERLQEALRGKGEEEQTAEQVHRRLEEAVAGYDSLKAEHALLQDEMASLRDSLGETETLRSELESLRERETLAQAELSSLRQDAAAMELARDELTGERDKLRHDLIDFEEAAEAAQALAQDDYRRELAELQAREEEATRARDSLAAEVADLHARLEAASNEAESAEIDALRNEMQLVREQAVQDIDQLKQQLVVAEKEREANARSLQLKEQALIGLRKELDEAEGKRRANGVQGAAGAAESHALRVEIDSLKRSLEERRAELDRSRENLHRLEEQIEERDSKVDRMQQRLSSLETEVDEAEFGRREALDELKRVQAAYRVANEDLAKVHTQGARISSTERSTGRRTLISALAGLLVGALLLDGVAALLGEGEVISGLFGKSTTGIAQQPAVVPASPGQGPVVQPPAPAPRQDVETATRAAPATPPAKTPAPVTPALPAPDEKVAGTLRDRLKSGGQGPEMIQLRGGTFTMGRSTSQLSSEESPAHKVEVGGFSIGRYEVTFDEYAKFARATGRRLPDDQGWGRGNRPVINVSWQDGAAYAEWLSAQTGEKYRLPSEAEWEYAAAGGTDTVYWWGFKIEPGRANCFNCGNQWDGRSSAPVGGFAPNPFGLHNTAGNVMEWVADCYHPNYNGAPGDGSSWVSPGCRQRVIRGGAFNKPDSSMRTTRREGYDAAAKSFIVGFRVVREIP